MTVCVQYHVVAQPLPTVVCLYLVTKSRETQVFCVLSYVSSWDSGSFSPSAVNSHCHEVKAIIDCPKKRRNLEIQKKMRSGYTVDSLWFESCDKMMSHWLSCKLKNRELWALRVHRIMGLKNLRLKVAFGSYWGWPNLCVTLNMILWFYEYLSFLMVASQNRISNYF